MNQKELTKTFMMTSNGKKLGLYKKSLSASRVYVSDRGVTDEGKVTRH